MYQESEYTILKGSEQSTSSYIFDKVLNISWFQNMSGF